MPSTLAYWGIRGLAEPLRLLLTYAGEDFVDKRYILGDAPEYNKDDWLNVKFTLGLPFPNLPYYMDDDAKLTETNAILRYLGRKHNLEGETPQERAECDVGIEVVMDLRNGFVRLCYGGTADDFKANRDKYLETVKTKIANFNDFLGDKQFFVGSKITSCDFHLYEMLTQHQILEPTILDAFPKLKAYCQRFEALPRIKEYLAAGKAKSPLNGPYAHFQ